MAMKQILKAFFVIAAAALTLVGCQKKEIAQSQNEGDYVYTFAIDEETRAVIGDSNIEWVAGDQVGMFIDSYGDYAGYKGYAKVDVSTTPKMVVLYSTTTIPAGATAYAYAPYDTENNSNDSDMVKIVVNNIQSGAEVSAMPLAGLPFTVEEAIDPRAQEGNGQIKFLNLGSVINFKIFSTEEEFLTETIKSIQFEANKAIAGVGYLDLTAVDMNDEASLELLMDTEENTVKVNDDMPVAAEKEEAEPIKMVILPGTFEGTLTVTTDVATYTKAIPEREFARSHSRTFGLDLAKAERSGLVEEVKPLPYEEAFASNQGDFVIEDIVKPDGLAAVWTFDSAYSCMKATGYVGGFRYETESMLVSPWIDLTGVLGAEITFKNAYNYITSPENYFTLWVKTNEAGSEWTKLTISNYGTGSFKWGDAAVNLTEYVGKNVKVAFKYISGGEDSSTGTWEIKDFSAHLRKLDAEISYAVTEFEAEVNSEFTAPALVNPNELTVTYSSSDSDIASVDENTGEVEIGAKEGTVTITATFAGDDNYESATAFYTIIVTDPSVVTVWVKTAASNLATGDYVVIVDETSVKAMSNDKGTSSAPSATSITISGNKLSSDPAENLQWIVTVNNGYKFQVPETSNYLYCTNTNNGVRVGTNTNNVFAIVDGFLYNNATSRYLGVYNNQDWRCYENHTGNIANTELAFYKKTTQAAGVTLSSIAITTAPTKTTFTVGESFVFDGVVTATYSDNTTADVTEYVTTDGAEVIATEGQNKTVTVSYTEDGVTKTTSYTVNVNPAQGGGEGGTVTIVAAALENNVLTDQGFVLTFAKNTGTTAPTYNSNGGDIRLYAKGTVTIAGTTPKTITNVVFHLSAAGLKRLPEITSNVGTVADQASGDETVTWDGSSTSVTFTVGETAIYGTESTKAGQLCFESVDITWE